LRTSFTYKQRHVDWQKKLISLILPIFILLTPVIALFIQTPTPVNAAPSDTLNFQGRLLTSAGGLVSDGSYNMQFNLYTVASGGSSEWTETRLNSGVQGVTVQNGYFSIYLGDVTAFSAIDWGQEHWLGMTVRGTGNCAWASCTPLLESEMTPRFKLTAVPYAFRAGAITDATGNAYTGDDLVQASPASIQALNTALAAIRLNQAGSGGLLQLQGDGSDVFTVDKEGNTVTFGTLDVKGESVNIGTTSQPGSLILNDGSGNTVTLTADGITSSYSLTLPINAGAVGECLKNDPVTPGLLVFDNCATGSGITSLNGLGVTSQTFDVGTSGTDFNINSTGSVHTFNIPDASATNRGLITIGSQTIAGAKTFSSLLTGNGGASFGANLTVTTGGITITGNSSIDGTLTGLTGLTVASGGANISGSSTIATTAGDTLGLGNSTGTLTVTGDSGSTFNINGVIVDATEFNRLNGKDAALLDVNDAVNAAITGTGALASGSITSGFGTISTANTITGTTLNGTSGINTGAGAGTQRIDSSGNLVNIGTITSGLINSQTISSSASFTGSLTTVGNINTTTGGYQLNGTNINTSGTLSNVAYLDGTQSFSALNTFNGGLTLGNAAILATNKGTDFSTTGTSSDVAFGNASLYRLTGASAQTITGIAGGSDGRILTLVNAGSASATLANNSGSSSAANRITTGTGTDIIVPVGSSISLIYDSTASLWRVSGDVAGGSGLGITAVGAINATATANGISITGTTLNLHVADGTHGGVVSNTTQTIAGAKTFSSLLTGNGGASFGANLTVTTGGITITGNSSIDGTLTGLTGLTVAFGGANISGSSTIATTAGDTLGLGNSTGTLTVTGDSGSSFNINGVIVDATEFNRLNGKDAALLDVNDAVNAAITGTGALASGSITSGFGTISTANTITGTTLNGTSGINTGAGAGTQRIDSSGNLVNIGTITSGLINSQTISSSASFTGSLTTVGNINTTTGGYQLNGTNINTSGTLSNVAYLDGTQSFSALNTFNGGLTLGNAAILATNKGTDFSTTGTSSDVAFGNASLYRLTGASAQTITGIAGGSDGRILTLVNAGSASATLANNSGSSSAANRITTGTGTDIIVPVGSSISLIYDSTASLWRVSGDVAGGSGLGITAVGAINATATANGISITGTTLNLHVADGTHGGVVSNTTQTIAGAKTFSSLLTGNGGASFGANLTVTTGGITITGNSSIDGTLTGLTGLTVAFGGANISGSSTIATTAGDTLGLGNSTGTLTVTGDSGSSFNINGVIVDATEFNRLNGKDAALLDVNDAVNAAITGTGALASGSITSGFGTISTANTITGTTLNGTSGINTGAGAGTQRIDSSGNLVNIGTITSGLINSQTISSSASFTGSLTTVGNINTTTGGYQLNGTNINTSGTLSNVAYLDGTQSFSALNTFNGGLTLGNAAILATNKGTDFSTTGTSSDVAFGNASLYRLTGASAQTITGIAGGSDGRILTLVNAGSASATLANNSGSSSAANRITTGTGTDIIVPVGSSISLIYDSTASLWRVSGDVAGGSGLGITAVGAINATATANGISITGTTLNLHVADGTHGGVVSNTTQTIAGAKTFSSLLTGNGGASFGANLTVTTGGITITGNSSIDGTLTGLTGLTVAFGGANISGSSTIATTAGDTLGLGNSTGTLTVTGDSGSSFNINGVIVDATEFNRLNGKDAALLDVNDAVNAAITGTGALASGSITSGFGTISTANTITGTTLNGTSGINTGAGAGTQRIDSSGNLVNIGTITSGLINSQTISSSASFTGSLTTVGNINTTTGGYQLNGTNINTSGTLSNVAYLSGTQSFSALNTFNGGLTITNGQNFTVGGDTFTSLKGTGLNLSGTSLAVSYGSIAGTAVEGNKTLTCASGSGNLSGGGDTITLGAGGSCSAISISNAPTFTTSVTSPLYTGVGAVTLSSGGTSDLTLNSASNTIKFASNVTTLQRTSAGTTTIDLNDNSTTVLALNNSGSGVANLDLSDGALFTSGVTRLSNAGVLSNVSYSDASNFFTGGALTANRGGTGNSTYVVGDMLFADTTSSLSRLAGVATGNVLISGGVSTAPSWGKAVLGTHTSGNYVSTINSLQGALTIAGTTNQVSVNSAGSTVTLSLPQDIATTSNVTFNSVTATSNVTSGLLTTTAGNDLTIRSLIQSTQPSAPTWHASDMQETFSSGNVTVNKPTNLSTGNLIIVVISYRDGGSVTANDPAFSLIHLETFSTDNDRGSLSAWMKVATASEPSTYSFTKTSGSAREYRAIAGRVSGNDLTDPLGPKVGANSGDTSVTSLTIPSITTTVDNTLLITAGNVAGNITTGSLSGFSGMSNAWLNDSSRPNHIGAYQTITPAGSTGTRQFNWTTSRIATGISFAIRPPLAGGGIYLQAGSSSVNSVIISNTGRVGIGTGSSILLDKLMVNGDIRVGMSGTDGCIKRYDGTGIVGSCSSDERLKKNITSIDSVLEGFKQLRPVTYNWRSDEFPEMGYGGGIQYGLIAQEVAELFPSLVQSGSNGYLTVDYGPQLTMLTIQAVNELSGEVDNVDKRLTVVEQKAENNKILAETLQVSATAEIAELRVSGETNLTNLTVSQNADVQGTLKVKNVVVNGDITVEGSVLASTFVTNGKNVSADIQVGLGIKQFDNDGQLILEPKVIAEGNNSSGTITLQSGKNSTSGALVEVLFNEDTPSALNPRIIISAKNESAAKLQAFVQMNSGGNGFIISSANIPLEAEEYIFDYFIIGTKVAY
jgi:fibronectin-binding autotransporter adhesin